MRDSTRERIVLDVRTAASDRFDRLWDVALRRGFTTYVVPEDRVRPPRGGETTLTMRGDRLVREHSAHGLAIPIHRVSAPADLEDLLGSRGPDDEVAVEWVGERVIPLENLVARRHGTGPTWVVLHALEEVPGALGALEHGADRIVVPIATEEALSSLEALLDEPTVGTVHWSTAELTSVRPGGLSDRVIVDTTSLLGATEGLLVGSAAAFLFHVPSERIGSRYTRPRPFRVNAGAPHSYVLMADGSTRYLAELEGGDAVFVATPGGVGRSVRVGRIKIERRPMVHVTAHRDERPFSVFLQEAETVRLTTEVGAVATTDLRTPARLVGVALPAARHLGTAVHETIEER